MKINEKPRTVYVTLGLLEEYMGLDEMLDILLQAKLRAEVEGISDVQLDITKEKGYYGDVEQLTLRIVGQRPETAEEVAIRLDAEQRETSARIKKLERELQALRGN